MNNLSIADIDNNMAYTFAVTVKYQISRLKITDGYGCSHCCLNTCTSRNRITEVQINLLGETGTVNTFCQAVPSEELEDEDDAVVLLVTVGFVVVR